MKGRARVPAIHTVSMASIVSWFSIRSSKRHLAVSGHGGEERAGPPPPGVMVPDTVAFRPALRKVAYPPFLN